MAKDSRSFFERLTGSVKVTDGDQYYDDEDEMEETEDTDPGNIDEEEYEEDTEPEEGTLSIDMYETPSDIIIKTVVAGTRPDSLDVSITREKVSIRGSRTPDKTMQDSEIHLQELFWGPFSREISLPEEIEVDEAEAIERYGLLIIRLPKINKNRETKLRIQASK